MNISSYLRESRLTKGLYSTLKKKKEKLYIKNFISNSLDVISSIQTIFDQMCFPYHVDMGTLLGLVREQGPIKHDRDIDFGIHISNPSDIDTITTTLKKNGCKLVASFYVDSMGMVQQSFKYRGIKIDVHYYRIEGDSDICYLLYEDKEMTKEPNQLAVVKLKSPHVKNIINFNVEGVLYKIPENAELYLQFRYGEDWRIPDPNYVYWKGPSCTPVDDTGLYVKED